MGSGNEQEYTVYKSRKRRTKRKVSPSVVDTLTVETLSPTCKSDEDKDNTPKAISNIIRMRWHNDMISVHNKRVKMGIIQPGPYTNIQRSSSGPLGPLGPNGPAGPAGPAGHLGPNGLAGPAGPNGHLYPPGLCSFSEPSSPIKFFENSTSARLFQIAQQYPPEYIPVPVMRPYMIPLYPDKEFYDGHGFIPSEFLSQ